MAMFNSYVTNCQRVTATNILSWSISMAGLVDVWLFIAPNWQVDSPGIMAIDHSLKSVHGKMGWGHSSMSESSQRASEIPSWLVVGPPLWKIWKSIGMIIPNTWENKKWQPNHQPASLGQVIKKITNSLNGSFRSSRTAVLDPFSEISVPLCHSWVSDIFCDKLVRLVPNATTINHPQHDHK